MRKAVCDKLELTNHQRFLFAMGAFAYDEKTQNGAVSLTVEDAEKCSAEVLRCIVYFIMQLQAAESTEVAAFDSVTLNGCCDVLGSGQSHKKRSVSKKKRHSGVKAGEMPCFTDRLLDAKIGADEGLVDALHVVGTGEGSSAE